jgi:muramoyltetrapeptide carboxypeptidase
MIKPKALRPGDTLGFVAPSSPVKTLDSVDKCIEAARAKGYKVVVGFHM